MELHRLSHGTWRCTDAASYEGASASYEGASASYEGAWGVAEDIKVELDMDWRDMTGETWTGHDWRKT